MYPGGGGAEGQKLHISTVECSKASWRYSASSSLVKKQRAAPKPLYRNRSSNCPGGAIRTGRKLSVSIESSRTRAGHGGLGGHLQKHVWAPGASLLIMCHCTNVTPET